MMERQWYAVYTRPQKERRVIAQLNKKGIECYYAEIGGQLNNKRSAAPSLLDGCIFVYIEVDDFRTIRNIAGVINFLYWKSQPARINEREIELLKKITAAYASIRVEKSVVEMDGDIKILEEPSIAYTEHAVSVKYKSIRVQLPSLGYVLIAERIKSREEIYYQASNHNHKMSFSKRINALLFN